MSKIAIPLIYSDQHLIEVIDELKYALRFNSGDYSEFRSDFNKLLTDFIQKWNLHKDQHMFASGKPTRLK